MMRVLSVVGARPQIIKAAALSRAMNDYPNLISNILVHSGQHYDDNLSEIFFRQCGLAPPAHQLRCGGGSHGEQTGRMLPLLEQVMLAERPDVVVLFGDTNTTLAAAVAASKIGMPVAHVEAGLRSFNRAMPEEINRILTDHVSDLLFAPTTAAVENLHREGIRTSAVHLVGDVMYDAALAFATSAEKSSTIVRDIELGDRGFVLATIHRQENTDDHARLADIFTGLVRIADEIPVVVPLHPRTRSRLQQAGIAPSAPQLKFLPPVGYLDMIALLQHARLVVTDSGGVQKEAFFFRVPCVTLRPETEWIELVQSGWNRLVAPESAEVVADGIRNALNSAAPARSESDDMLYGGGKAARKIVQVLLENQCPGKCQ